jgi:hypothetical protein
MQFLYQISKQQSSKRLLHSDGYTTNFVYVYVCECVCVYI